MRHRPFLPARRDGFTLIELMVALGVIGVLLLLAAPSVREMLLMQRLKNTHSQIVTDLQFARATAVSSGTPINFRVLAQDGPDDACYIIFEHVGYAYTTVLGGGASNRCNCRRPPGQRCVEAGTRELRTVTIPRSLGLRVEAGQNKREVAFNPVNGGMMLVTNEAGVGAGADFKVNTVVDGPRTLTAVVGLSGRPATCRPAGSTMPEPAC